MAAEPLGTGWTELGPEDELPSGSHRVYEVDSRFVAVYNVGGELYAIEDRCTHDDNPLSDGPVEGHEVICPRHGARFCLRSGAALSPPAYEPVACYKVQRRNGRIYVEMG